MIFLFFSAARSKLATYMLPSFPAIALLVAGLWNDLLSNPAGEKRRALAWSLAPVPVLFSAASGFIMAGHPVFGKMEAEYGIGLRDLVPFAIVVAGGTDAAFVLLLRRLHLASFAALAATMAGGFLAVLLTVIPAIDPYRSTVKLAREMDQTLPPGEPLIFFWDIKDTALFYTERRATLVYTEEDVLKRFASGSWKLCLIQADDYARLPRLAAASSIVDREGNKLLIAPRLTSPASQSVVQ